MKNITLFPEPPSYEPGLNNCSIISWLLSTYPATGYYSLTLIWNFFIHFRILPFLWPYHSDLYIMSTVFHLSSLLDKYWTVDFIRGRTIRGILLQTPLVVLMSCLFLQCFHSKTLEHPFVCLVSVHQVTYLVTLANPLVNLILSTCRILGGISCSLSPVSSSDSNSSEIKLFSLSSA